VRVPLYHPGNEKATRAELRCPDPSCNPYLTFAALLQAGLEGIEQGYELPDPIESNLYDLSEPMNEKLIDPANESKEAVEMRKNLPKLLNSLPRGKKESGNPAE
jgi:glutamine synthetase